MPDIQVFGRRAGIAAAEDAKAGSPHAHAGLELARARAAELTAPIGRAEGVRPIEVKRRVQKLMWDHVGIVRNATKLEETLRAFTDLRENVMPRLKVNDTSRVLNREWMESLELENMLDLAEAMAATSIERKETRGAFYRTDFPDTDPQWTANLWVRREGGRVVVEKRPVAKYETRAGGSALAAAASQESVKV
jgi:succinate dehydrogenase / fumarate reductase flavoprotein subunit